MINKLADLAQKAEPAFWLPGHPTDTLRSTTGDGVLNCQVRHGTGWIHSSISTGNFTISPLQADKGFMRLRPRCISIGQLKGRYPLTPPTYQTGRLPDTLLL